MTWLPCPYLGGEVELTEERQRHIALRHPTLLPRHIDLCARVLADPDQVRLFVAGREQLLFVREFDELTDEAQIVVVVLEDEPATDTEPPRRWLVTAYRSADDYVPGTVIWEKHSS